MEYTFQIREMLTYYHVIYKGLFFTITISLLAIIIRLITGWALAIARIFGNKLVLILCGAYIESWRNTPLLVQLFFVYFSITAVSGLSFTAFQAGLIAIILNTTAYNAEILRGGILSIPKIQIESAKSLGLSFFQILRTIIIPYDHRIVFPALNCYDIRGRSTQSQKNLFNQKNYPQIIDIYEVIRVFDIFSCEVICLK